MARCEECRHFDVCYLTEIDNDIRDNGENPNCLHFSSTDVVPREEVENLKVELAKKIFDDLEASICVHTFTNKSEDYIEGACDTMEWVDSKIDELKKKYTEEDE